MKVLGVVQFQQKKFKMLGIDGKYKELLGDVPKSFIAIIHGKSGNGKTELCVQLAKYLCGFGSVAWLSYEQGHGYDFQKACERNGIWEENGKFFPIDPNENRDIDKTYMKELDEYLSRRNAPDFVFIDSLDYVRPNLEEYQLLKQRHGKRKAIFFISHSYSKEPKMEIGRKIKYDGHISIYVDKYIAQCDKNRFGSFAPYIIYEERARELNPIFFAKKDKNKAQATIFADAENEN